MVRHLKFTILLFVLATSFSVAADQPGPVVLYDVDVDSILAAAPDLDLVREAHIVILLNKEDIDVRPDLTSRQTIHQIVLITSAEGIRMAGTTIIGYRRGVDSVAVHRACSRTADGSVHEVSRGRILYDLVPEEYIGSGMYTDSREVHINFESVDVGTIVESIVTIDYGPTAIPGYCYSYHFGLPVPVMQSAVSIRCDDSIDVKYRMFRMISMPRTSKRDGRTVRIWSWAFTPAVMYEPFCPPAADLTWRIDFSTFESWETYGNAVYSNLWKEDLELPLTASEKAFLERVVAGATSNREKMKALYYAVQDEVRYLGLEFGHNNWKPYPSDGVLKQKYGDCKDNSNLLVKLLREAGIPASPVVLATSDLTLELPDDFPSANLLDHVVVYVPDCEGESYWLDPSLEMAPLGWMPPTIEGQVGILLEDGASRAIQIPQRGPENNPSSYERVVTMDENGGALVEEASSFGGSWSVFGMKPTLAYATPIEREQLIQSFVMPDDVAARDLKFEVFGLDDHDSALVIKNTYASDAYAQPAGDLLVLRSSSQPVSEWFDHSGGLENRHSDLMIMGPSRTVFKSTCRPPEGFGVQYLPPDLKLDNEFFAYEKTTKELEGGDILLILVLDVKTRRIRVTKYEKYHELISQINKNARERPILQRR